MNWQSYSNYTTQAATHMGPPRRVSVWTGLGDVGPIALMSVREAAPWRNRGDALGCFGDMAPRSGKCQGRSGGEGRGVALWQAGELAGQPGLIPSPESHFRDECFAWAIRL
jgi:hypothetical protein